MEGRQMTTAIEWTDETWNPTVGCSRVSAGCDGCYAIGWAKRLAAMQRGIGMKESPYEGLTVMRNDRRDWAGVVRPLPERLEIPLRKAKAWAGKRIFVNSMSDLFHEQVPFDFIDKVFAVIALCPDTVFMILTKRPERMRAYFEPENIWARIEVAARKIYKFDLGLGQIDGKTLMPILPNVWLGTSVEDQKTADERIPHLLATPAAIRFVSYEPALGPVDFYGGDPDPRLGGVVAGKGVSLEPYWEPGQSGPPNPGIDWLIVGGESGPGARPMHPDWARSARDQCQAAGVPFFFKQKGEWDWMGAKPPGTKGNFAIVQPEGSAVLTDEYPRAFNCFGASVSERVGKKKAGSSLDGKEWKEFPETKFVATK